MALHTELPIHKVAYDLMAVAIEAARNMPRDVKQLMGGKIRDLCLELLGLIYQANVARDKVPAIDALRGRLQDVEVLLRLSVDLRYITRPAYARAIEHTTRLGKQATGWRRSSAPSPAA